MPISPLIARQRAQLARLHRHTAGQIATAYGHARQQVTPAMRAFADAYAHELQRVQSANADGGADGGDGEEDQRAPDRTQHVSLIWLHTSGHLGALRGPVLRAVGQAAHTALSAALDAQHQALNMGQASAVALLRDLPPAPPAPPDAAEDDGGDLSVPPLPPGRHGKRGRDGLSLTLDYGQLAPDAWTQVQQTAAAQAATGASAAALVVALLAVVAAQAVRATLLSQHESTLAYRQAVALTFAANPDAVTGWVWVCSFANSCAACIAMHGSRHDADETLDGHPGCQCQQQPYRGAPPDDIQGGEAWFAEQDAATQRDILGPAAYQAIQLGDVRSIGSLIDTSQGYVSQASLRSLGLDARDYLT